MTSRRQARLLTALVACAAVLAPSLVAADLAAPRDSDSEDRCKVALKTQKFVLDQFSQVGGIVTEDSHLNEDLTKLLLETLKKQSYASNFASDDLYTPLLKPPYSSWANQRIQAAMSSSVYVPSANMGEIMYAVANISAELNKLDPRETMIDTMETSAIWSNAWYELADHVMDSVGGKGCPDTTDRLSCSSAVLRAMNYVLTGQYSNPSSSESIKRLQDASAAFDKEMAKFEQSYTEVYNMTFNNGTHDADIRTMFVAPSGSDPVPLLVMWVPPGWVLEEAYMRYALGAMRRGYASLIFEGPGSGMTIRLPPYMPTYRNTTEVVVKVLDTAMARPEIADRVDTDKVALVGLESSSFAIGKPCIDLASELAACVMGPPVISIVASRRARLITRFYGAITNISRDHPDWFGDDDDIVYALDDAENRVYEPLLHDCPEESGAPQLFNAIFGTAGILPDSLYPILAAVGVEDRDEPQKLLDVAWHAWRRAEDVDTNWKIEDLTVPVFMSHGHDDMEYLAHTALELFEQLPKDIRDVSMVIEYAPSTGAALAGQRGATPVLEQDLYPFLKKTLAASSRRKR